MLKIIIPAVEHYDEVKNIFIKSKEQTLILEHSLVSISKWESKWHKPFLANKEKSLEETVEYIKCMTVNSVEEGFNYGLLTHNNIKEVNAYIANPMTATTFSNQKKTLNREITTAEIIYHWMVALNIPFECQKWHLNRLLTLINVCNIKNSPPSKMNKKEAASRRAALNSSRKRR